MTSAARDALEHAYRAAQYRVLADDAGFCLYIDVPSTELDGLLLQHGVTQAALLTAANPGSRPLTAAQNSQRHAALRDSVAALGLQAVPACNHDPRGKWPDESALLVLGLALTSARQLAALYGQNAWLWCGRGQPVRLVWTEDC